MDSFKPVTLPSPVILLAFANEQQDTARYLRDLPNELNRLRDTLLKAEDRELCEVVILSNTTLDNLVATFQREKYRNRIALFHYGGHADSYELLLEGSSGSKAAYGEGLVPFLAGQKGLKCIFLNGCFSAQQAQALVDRGLPAVIGTSQAVDDGIATELATAFYHAIGEGLPLDQAWREATFKIMAEKGAEDLNQYYQQDKTRSAHFVGMGKRSLFPWEIYYRPGAEEIRNWNLPAAAADPYFGLPEIPGGYYLPDVPYRFLERYKKEDAQIFFGRGAYIRDLYHRVVGLHTAPAVLLYGQSGVGKSSLLEAGIFPRLEEDYQICFARRDSTLGLSTQLMELLGIKDRTVNPETLLKAWKQLEEDSDKKGLLLVFDQVEEVYTRPHETETDELENFLQLAAGIFAQAQNRPKGKLLLSYRKEYDPEIEKAYRQAGLPKEKVFLDRLDRRGIQEVVKGLGSSKLLQNKYRLQVEATLPTIIADDLLTDRDSPISPVLQIILTRLWQQEEKKDQRQFQVDDYNELRKQGILLDDFFQQQMSEIKAWGQQLALDVEKSGLALDILYYHTTPLGTAESRDLGKLRELYQHRADILGQLIGKFNSLYLLTSLGKEKSALAHDTLAPIVQKQLNESDKPGQRALRILSSKGLDYELSPNSTYLDEEDLALVERGVNGMRMWTSKEAALIEKSRKRRAKLIAERKRNQYLKTAGVTIIGILGVIALLLWLQTKRQANVNALVGEALRLERMDATKALDVIKQALRKLPGDRNALQARHDIYSENEFYHREIQTGNLETSDPVFGVALSPEATLIGAASGAQVILLDTTGKRMYTLPHNGRVNSVCFSPDGQLLLTASDDQTARLWNLNGVQEKILEGHDERLRTAVFSKNGSRILTGGHQGNAILWNRNGNQLFSWRPHQDSITTLAFVSDDRLVTAGWDYKTYLWQWDGSRMIKQDSLMHKARPISLNYNDERNLLAVGYRDGTAILFLVADVFQKQLEIKAHTRRINKIIFTADGNYFLTASDDYQIRLWKTNGDLIRTYKGHEDFVEAIDFDLSARYFVSGDADGKVKIWKRDSKAHQTIELQDVGVLDIAVFPDGQSVLVGTGEKDLYQETDSFHEIELQNYPLLKWKPAAASLDTLGEHLGGIKALAISEDGSHYLTGSRGGKSTLWNQSGRFQDLVDTLGIDVQAVAFEPWSQRLVTAEDMPVDNQMSLIFFWDRQGNLVETNYPGKWINDLVFSPNAKSAQWLLACEEGQNGISYLVEGEGLDSLALSGRKIRSLAFSEEGDYFAIGESGKNALIHVFDSQTRERLFFGSFESSNKTGGRAITDIAFSPDSRYVAAGAEGGLVKIFDLKLDGQEIQTMDNTEGADVTSLAFMPPDGRWLLVGSRNGMIKKYRIMTK